MIKCILFDIGGVIVDFYNEEDYYPYLVKVSGKPFARIRRMINDDIRIDIDKGTKTQRFFDSQVANQLGIRVEQVRWYDFYKRKSKLINGTIDVIKRLSGSYKLGYLSNTDRSRYTYTVEKILKPYLNLFDYRFASCDIRLRKPDAAVYKYALHAMSLRAGEVVFIDNQIENVAGANRVGMKAIWFRGSRNLEKRLKRMEMLS